ncbi:inactive leucine-rich repeat receptor-like serine/threonine-protein kinase At1g60630 isoform X2 [Ricinus communis]|uniref:inactive leucine-rich repeat receptor-like serine/threonine-protein kinase At1g60630 isoform X2 n=1 Tax=Ricinus communis TaxID=3988 RepID=UPI00201B238A|nr:inactive leucine-rich repeat receptor-like serine/threonine-protein kinase At1g60630 isoform X2 [Ricinus communis]
MKLGFPLLSPIKAQLQLERDALYALKANFNDPFLNVNWSGSQCPRRYPTQWYGIICANGKVSGIFLEDMGLTGTVRSDAFSVFTELTILSFKNNSISGEVMNFSSNAKMREINLSGNKFQGPISRSLLSLVSLESLQLQDNNLTGSIPEFNQSSLRVFDVSNNNLQGEIPKTPILQSFSFGFYSSNSELCGPPTNTACNNLNDTADSNTTAPSEPEKDSSSKPNKLGTVFLLFDVAGLLAVILLFILYFRKARKLKKILKKHGTEEREQKQSADEDYDDFETEQNRSMNVAAIYAHGKEAVVEGEEKGNLIFLQENVKFKLNDLLKASAEGLGKGVFGNTYKAMMEGMPAVVVKRLRDLKPLTSEEFRKHSNIIADQKHPNLLPLLAYYYSKEEKLMVYRFAEKGNVFNRIHGGRGNNDRIPFRWNARLSVARGVARALEYLHLNKSQSIVPHGNLKSSNVLLDENEMVLVSDHGLTSLIALTIASNRMASYKSPEYHTSKKVTRKSDVWSYGCLLLELLTGRVSAHSAPPGTTGVDICSWVHRAVREEWTAEIFDIEISVQRNSAPGMLKLLQVAIRCCEKSPEKRPEMTQVVKELNNIRDADSEEEDLSSFDQSLTDESLSTSASGIIGNER